MRLLRYFFVPWTMFLVYFLFSAVLGQNGLYARRHLEAELAQLRENNRTLERAHSDLQVTRDALLHDQDMLSVYARQLGYGRENEEFIRIMGLGVAINASMPTGQALYATNAVFVQDKTIKLIALFFGMTVLVFFLVMDFLSFKTRDLES